MLTKRCRDYNRASVKSPNFHKIDFSDDNYTAHIWLYIFCGLLDSMWQTTAYWMMGAMSSVTKLLGGSASNCSGRLHA